MLSWSKMFSHSIIVKQIQRGTIITAFKQQRSWIRPIGTGVGQRLVGTIIHRMERECG